MSEAAESCRIDVWLWRARFFKTRGLAARFVEQDGVRLRRGANRLVLDKASRQVRAGDLLTFLLGTKYIAARVENLGERRGPAAEARQLFTRLDIESN